MSVSSHYIWRLWRHSLWLDAHPSGWAILEIPDGGHHVYQKCVRIDGVTGEISVGASVEDVGATLLMTYAFLDSLKGT